MDNEEGRGWARGGGRKPDTWKAFLIALRCCKILLKISMHTGITKSYFRCQVFFQFDTAITNTF